jgi:clan AA aspartic protease
LISIQVGATNVNETHELLAWVDTAFNGSLVIPKSKIETLGLVQESSAEAILADGNKVALETYGCRVKWFGKSYDTQVFVNESEYALLGTILLEGHRLEIDYENRVVSIH